MGSGSKLAVDACCAYAVAKGRQLGAARELPSCLILGDPMRFDIGSNTTMPLETGITWHSNMKQGPLDT
jgi:hypothetical protein